MKKLLYAVAALLAFTSCKNWFDAAPKTNYSDEKSLFSSEDSYRNFLNNIYSSMRVPELYGYIMNQGGVEFLGQTLEQSGEFSDWINYNYQSAAIQTALSDIYELTYKNIYSCNRFLELLDSYGKDVVFMGGSYEMMTGEAIALRAFLHFELIRLFNPSMKVDPDFNGIKWIDGTGSPALELSTRQMLEKISDELKTATDLMWNTDPIRTGKGLNSGTLFGTLFGTLMEDRYWKMNYYAAIAVKARVHMALEQYADAAGYARTIYTALNAKDVADGKAPEKCALQFPMIKTFSNDRAFSQEHIFALPSEQNEPEFSYPSLSNSVFSQGTVIASHLTARLLDLPADDKRLDWFSSDRTSLNRKFGGSPSNIVTGWNLPQRMPLIKVGEMYLLAAEAKVRGGSINEGLSILNEYIGLRLSDSKLGTNPTAEDILGEITRHLEIELIGEGQIFFYHKRINASSIGGTSMTAQKYTMPIPHY